HPAVAPDVVGTTHVGEEVGDLALLGRQLDGHVERVALDGHGGEHLVLGHLEDRVAPGRVLVGLREGERELPHTAREGVRVLHAANLPTAASVRTVPELDPETQERIEDPVSEEAEREVLLTPAEAVARMRINAPARGNTKLRRLLERVNDDLGLKAWWH